MSTQTEIELAKQAGWEYADGDGGFEPLWRFAELVRVDERAKLAEQPAQQGVVAMRDAIVVNLVREGVSKHRARELADHILATTPQAQPARLPLTDDELADLWYKQSLDWMEFARAIEAKLREKNQ